MEIHKFGGASIKDSASIKNVCNIIKDNIKCGVIVVSAMGKNTNHLEELALKYYNKMDYKLTLQEFLAKNIDILKNLFDNDDVVWEELDAVYSRLKTKLKVEPSLNFDFEYDQIVTFGEVISAKVLSNYLLKLGVSVVNISAFRVIKTDSNFREANVDWKETEALIQKQIFSSDELYLTQGFVGSDRNNLPVTLGREGSDFTAAIIGSILNADKVTVWKDVPGVMCADPAWIPNCEVLQRLSFHETIELAYFGAKVIHPKTIKPLQNKNIPLQVRSFVDTSNTGTLIDDAEPETMPPIFVRKEKQVLISIWQSDFSFIVEKNLSHIFAVFHEHKVKVNIMQNSAISFSTCVDGQLDKIIEAIKCLRENYHVKYNDELELISIRHNQPGVENDLLNKREVLLEQKSRSMARFVVKSDQISD